MLKSEYNKIKKTLNISKLTNNQKMQVLQQTQFAKHAPLIKGMPPFLARKLEEAIVEAHLKGKKDPKKALEEKLERAQRKRD